MIIHYQNREVKQDFIVENSKSLRDSFKKKHGKYPDIKTRTYG